MARSDNWATRYPEIQDVYRRLAPEMAESLFVRVGDENDLVRSRLFEGCWSHYDWDATYTSTQYGELMRTHSDHGTLQPGVLDELVSGVAECIDDGGGSIEYPYRTKLFLARPVR